MLLWNSGYQSFSEVVWKRVLLAAFPVFVFPADPESGKERATPDNSSLVMFSLSSCPIRVDVCNNCSILRLTTELINLGILIYLLLFSFKLDKRGQLLFTFSAVLKRQWPVQTRHQIQCDFVMLLRPQWDQKKKTLVSTVNVVLNHKLSNNYKTWLKKLWRRFI